MGKFLKVDNNLFHERQKESFLKYVLGNKWLYILLAPGMIYLIIFHYVPIYGILIAFKELNVVKGIWESPWIGLQNFNYLFNSEAFYSILKNSLGFSFLRLLLGFPAPIILALMLNEVRSIAFKRSVQTIIYIPHFISWVVVAGIVSNVLAPTSQGVLNSILGVFGVQPVNLLIKPEYFRQVVISAEIWKQAGWGTIIYLAALSGIDPNLYEAAIVDGANRLKMIWHITLPGIMSTIIVLLILRLGRILSNGFEQIFLLYSPMVYNVADVFETYTYRVGLQEGNFGYATAVGLFQSIVGFILIVGSNKFSKRGNKEGSLW